MPLPVLKTQTIAQPADLVRFYLRTERLWAEHLADPVELDIGTLFMNPQLPDVGQANQILDVRIPPGQSAEEVIKIGSDFFAERGGRCLSWTLNPMMPETDAIALDGALRANQFEASSGTVMHLPPGASTVARTGGGLRFIPARASFRHARALFQEQAKSLSSTSSVQQQFVDAQMAHLDDPHWDSVIAWEGVNAIGIVGVLVSGEVGRIDQLFVAKVDTGIDVVQLLLSKVVEICARSQLKHVLIANSEPQAMRFGFRAVGPISDYSTARPIRRSP